MVGPSPLRIVGGLAVCYPAHTPYVDDDEDQVCHVCRRVLRVGPLGLNGVVSTGERLGFVSALAVVEADMRDTPPDLNRIEDPPYGDRSLPGWPTLPMITARRRMRLARRRCSAQRTGQAE